MKIISNKNIYFSLITLFSLTLSVDAFAQQNPIFQQAYRAPKELSNLAPAAKFAESFLGQDKPGPYILTYKNINFYLLINFLSNSFNFCVLMNSMINLKPSNLHY
jgi:hypothetical protein